MQTVRNVEVILDFLQTGFSGLRCKLFKFSTEPIFEMLNRFHLSATSSLVYSLIKRLYLI